MTGQRMQDRYGATFRERPGGFRTLAVGSFLFRLVVGARLYLLHLRLRLRVIRLIRSRRSIVHALAIWGVGNGHGRHR